MGCDHEDRPNCDCVTNKYGTDSLLDALRSSTLDVPNELCFTVFHTFSMDGLTDPDEEVYLLTDIREPSGRYRDGLLITANGHPTICLLARRALDRGAGRWSDHLFRHRSGVPR